MNANKITWERTDDLLEIDPEEREVVYVLEGIDKDGKLYSAIGTYVCGHLEKIEGIEEVTPTLAQK